METPKRLQGVLAPVLTPFNVDLSPARERFVRHCRWLLDQGAGLAIFGTNSEAASLSLAEKRQLLDVLLEAGLPPNRMMPGTGACALPEVIELTRAAVQAGCGGVLMIPPYYYKGVSDEGLYRAYASVVDAVADDRLRIYLYHIPAVSQVPVTRALLERLLKTYPGTIAGMKDSSGDWNHTAAMLAEFQSYGFGVFCGNENFLLSTMQAGGTGCISATANVNPGPIVSLYREWRHTDAPARQAMLDATRAVFQQFPMIPAMKAAIAWQSGCDVWRTVRPPLVELGPGQRRSLEDTLNSIGFGMPGATSLT